MLYNIKNGRPYLYARSPLTNSQLLNYGIKLKPFAKVRKKSESSKIYAEIFESFNVATPLDHCASVQT